MTEPKLDSKSFFILCQIVKLFGDGSNAHAVPLEPINNNLKKK